MKVVLDSLFYNAGNFMYLGAQWIISIALVRMGGFEDAGYFSLAMSFGNIFCVFSNYVLRTYQVSDIDNKFKDSTYVVLRAITIIISVLICFGFAAIFMGYTRELNLLILCYILFKIPESYADVLTGIWQKNGNMLAVGISNAIKGIFSLVTFLCAYFYLKSLLSATFIMAVSHIAVLVSFDFSISNRYINHVKLYKEFDKKEILGLLGVGFSNMIFTLCTILFTSIPRIVIERELDAAALGVFSSLYNPTATISMFAVGVLLPVIPKMARYYKEKNKKSLSKVVVVCNSIIFATGIAAGIVCALIGRQVFSFVFGNEILKYFNLVYIFIAISVLIAIVNCYSSLFIATRKLKPLLVFTVLSCVFVFLACVLLIPKYNIHGAAYASICVIGIQFAAETLYIIGMISKVR